MEMGGLFVKTHFVKKPMQFSVRDVEVEAPESDEIVVAPRACGVCGFDVLTAKFLAEDWMGIGHEVTGEVAEVGTAVRNVAVGDRVVVENSTFCGLCVQCKRGNVVHCSSMNHYLSPGAFAERLKVKARAVYPLGDLDFCAGALAEPLTVAIDMVEAADIPLSGSVVVFGPGPIGLMICRLALLKGAARVYLTGHAHSEARWQAADTIGVTEKLYVDAPGFSLQEYFREHEPQGVDRVLVTSPPATVAEAVDICRFGGIIAYDGISFDASQQIVLDGNALHFKRLQLRGVHSVPNLGWPQALDLLGRRVIDPEVFISQTFPFAEVPEAVRFAADNRKDTVKVMVDFAL